MKRVIGRSRFFEVAIAISLATVWVMSGPRSVIALQDSEDMPPPFGLALGQTARLNILNSGQPRGYIIDWKFLDSTGRVVAQSDGRVSVPTDQFRSFDLDGDSLALPRDRFGRVQLRAVVTTVGNPEESGNGDLKNLGVSIEVVDNATGKTTVFCQNNL